jgi:hypothetical protein
MEGMMPIRIRLEKTFELSDIWCDRKIFEEELASNRRAFLELLNEDWTALIDEAGGLEVMLQKYEWVEG